MDIYSRIVDLIESARPFCLATVLGTEGSTPREAGVKAVIEACGRIHSTVGGGSVEAETQRTAVDACRSGQLTVLDVELAGESAGGPQPICGGSMRILVDPTAAKDGSAYAEAAAAL